MFQLRTRIQAHRAARSCSPLRGRSPRARPLALEALEDRCLLSSYSLTPTADTGPNSPYSGLEVGQAINNLGAVAFEANLKSGGEGIFTRNPDGSQGPIIAITSDLISTFTFSPYMNDSGTVSFGAALRDGSTAIFTGDGQELTRIADTEPNSPFSSLPSPAPRIRSDGTVTFQAFLRSGGGKGFFVANGGLPSILYVPGGQFSAFPGSPASQVNGDTVVFRGTLQDGTGGVFTGNGGPTTTIATTGGDYSTFIDSEIGDDGTVAFSANLTAGGQAILIARDGTLSTFVDTSGPYSQFFAGPLSINNQRVVVFGATLAAGGTGIFDGPDPVADKILATGDPFDGSVVVGFPANYLNPRGLNNEGQAIFRADLADGRTVLVRADPSTVSLAPAEASDLGVLVGVTEHGQTIRIDRPAFSAPESEEGRPLATFTSAAGMKSPAWDQAVRSVAAPLPLRVAEFAAVLMTISSDFQPDWLSDTLMSDLVMAG